MIIGGTLIFIVFIVLLSVWGEKLLFPANKGKSKPKPTEKINKNKPHIRGPVIAFLNRLYKEPHLFRFKATISKADIRKLQGRGNPIPDRYRSYENYLSIMYKGTLIGMYWLHTHCRSVSDEWGTSNRVWVEGPVISQQEIDYAVYCVEQFYKKRLERVDNIKKIRENRLQKEALSELTEQFRR